MPITIKDLARMTNTSPATVSRVLSNKPGVAKAKREAIQRLARQLGYQPNRNAQSLVTQQSLFLGFIASEVRNPGYAIFLHQMEEFGRQHGYQTLMADSSLDVERERYNVETMIQHRAAGLLIFPVADWHDPCNHGHLLQLQHQRFPFVLAGKIAGFGFNCVYSEEIEAAEALTQHLLDLGHKRFGFLGAESQNRPAREREEGVRRALLAAGLLQELHEQNNPALQSIGVSADPNEAVRRMFSGEYPPTALIAVSSELGLRYYRSLDDVGLSIPQDVSMVGFDDMSWCAWVKPALTVSASDQADVADLALATLLERIKHPDAPAVDRPVPKRLIVRESTDVPPLRSKRLA